MTMTNVPTMSPTDTVSASTIRTRHFRERQRAGIWVVQFELLPEEVDAFVRRGLITAAQRVDRAALFKALEHVLNEWLESQRQSS